MHWIFNFLQSTLNMSVFLYFPTAVQREVEGKTMRYIMSIMMSIICFFVMLLFAKAITAASVCESVLGYYQVVIVSLDCSSDIQQIKLKRDILSMVTRSQRKKRLMC